MVSAFILYYLNMKPTHGYEIQKFLQVSGVEQWTKIQSGSIYYALTKLEKEKHIRVLREERTDSRIRKVFEITESGRKQLRHEMAAELDKPISNIGSMKFFIEPVLSTLDKEEMREVITRHIKKLQEQKESWEKWYHIKVDESASGLARLSFEMTIENIGYQIRWHQELLEHLEDYIEASRETEQIIRNIDFDRMESGNPVSEEEQKLQYALKLKNEIMKDPQNAVVNLDKIIEELQSQIGKKDR
jgi:DNA-binding PadR family transcriptional regulator